MDDLNALEAADNAGYAALAAHWNECDRAATAHPLDDSDCPTWRRLFDAFKTAQTAHFDALSALAFPDDAPPTADLVDLFAGAAHAPR